jgi:hypothetical protein
MTGKKKELETWNPGIRCESKGSSIDKIDQN